MNIYKIQKYISYSTMTNCNNAWRFIVSIFNATRTQSGSKSVLFELPAVYLSNIDILVAAGHHLPLIIYTSYLKLALGSCADSLLIDTTSEVLQHSWILLRTHAFPFCCALSLAGSELFPDVILFFTSRIKGSWLRARRQQSSTFSARRASHSVKMAKFHVLILCSFVVIGAMAADKAIGGSIAGGFSPVDVNDKEVQEMAAFATTAVASNTNTGPLQLVKVLSAETQVVAGRNYRMKLEFTRKNAVGGTITCEVIIWDQPWTNTRKLTQSKCAPLLAKNWIHFPKVLSDP